MYKSYKKKPRSVPQYKVQKAVEKTMIDHYSGPSSVIDKYYQELMQNSRHQILSWISGGLRIRKWILMFISNFKWNLMLCMFLTSSIEYRVAFQWLSI